jgi:hypothetical protein
MFAVGFYIFTAAKQLYSDLVHFFLGSAAMQLSSAMINLS